MNISVYVRVRARVRVRDMCANGEILLINFAECSKNEGKEVVKKFRDE